MTPLAVLLAAALAHPVGNHRSLHHARWEIRADETTVRYAVEVPDAYLRGADPWPALRDELVSGLRLAVDGQTSTWRVARFEHGPAAHVVRAELELVAPLSAHATRLELSNGNLPLTPARLRTDLAVSPAWRVVDGSLLVRHEGEVVRSESGRILADERFRRVWVELERDDGLPARVHRWAIGAPDTPRSDFASLAPSAWDQLTLNRTTPASALGLAALLGVAGAAGRPAGRRGPGPLLGVAVGLLELGLGGPRGDLLFAGLAIACAGLATRRADAWWAVAPALAASLDASGLALAVAALQLAPLPGTTRRRAVAAVALALAAAQLARALPR